MSVFLGPIRYWMYEKIENNWRRERAIAYGDEHCEDFYRKEGAP